MQNKNTHANIVHNGEAITPDAYNEIVQRVTDAVISHLENTTESNETALSHKGDGPDMATTINRSVILNGKKCWIHANTEQEYADKLLKLSADSLAPATAHDFKEYALNWFKVYAKPSIATATATTKYVLPNFAGKAVEDVTVDDIQVLFNDMKSAKATKDKVKMVLNMILESAVDDGIIPKNPMSSKRLRITGSASKVTEVYSVEDMQYIIGHIGDIKLPGDRAYIAIQALHPLRLEEVLGLQWADIDTDNMVIHIRRAVTHPDRNRPEIKATKTEASVRDIALCPTALQYLTPGNPDEFVCGGEHPLAYTQVRHMRQRIKKDMNFDGDITPIRFRTTVLTDIYAQTKDIKLTQNAAGHTTSAMTLKYYVKPRELESNTTAAVIDATYCVPAV